MAKQNWNSLQARRQPWNVLQLTRIPSKNAPYSLVSFQQGRSLICQNGRCLLRSSRAAVCGYPIHPPTTTNQQLVISSITNRTHNTEAWWAVNRDIKPTQTASYECQSGGGGHRLTELSYFWLLCPHSVSNYPGIWGMAFIFIVSPRLKRHHWNGSHKAPARYLAVSLGHCHQQLPTQPPYVIMTLSGSQSGWLEFWWCVNCVSQMLLHNL